MYNENMEKDNNYRISKDILASLVQYMAYAQKEFIYENMILRTVSKDFKGYSEEQQEKLHDRINTVLPYQANTLGQHINALLRDYPKLHEDEFVINALKDRDKAIEFVTEFNEKDGYKPKMDFNPDDTDSIHGLI